MCVITDNYVLPFPSRVESGQVTQKLGSLELCFDKSSGLTRKLNYLDMTWILNGSHICQQVLFSYSYIIRHAFCTGHTIVAIYYAYLL